MPGPDSHLVPAKNKEERHETSIWAEKSICLFIAAAAATFARQATRHSRSVPCHNTLCVLIACPDRHSSPNSDSIQTLSMRGRTFLPEARPVIVVMHALKGVKHSTFITALRSSRPAVVPDRRAASCGVSDRLSRPIRFFSCSLSRCYRCPALSAASDGSEWRSESALHSPHSRSFFC